MIIVQFMSLSLNQVFEFDVRMAVLTLFKCLTTVDADGLLWADMDTAEADGTVVANMGFLLDHNIAHRADTRTGLATGTFVFVDHRMESAQHAVLQERPSHDASGETPPRKMPFMFLPPNVRDDAVEAESKTLEFPCLLVGITPKCDGAVIRHANLVRISQFNTFLTQQTPQGPKTVACLSAAGRDCKDVRLLAYLQSRHECSHSRRHVEVIGRKDQTDTLLVRQVLLNRFGQRQYLVVYRLGYLSRDGEAVTCS